jgi:hypothetical protein
MEDKARMIAAARRMARRIAKKTDITYQQALDRVARDLGRDHWAHYASDPVLVPRDDAPDPSKSLIGDERLTPNSVSKDILTWVEKAMKETENGRAITALLADQARQQGYMRIVPAMHEHEVCDLSGEDWNMPLEKRPVDVPSGFLPGWNALDDRFVGAGVSDEDRERHVERIAEILIPRIRRGDLYFVEKGRMAMIGFLLVEIAKARIEGRRASIPTMVDWISRGMVDATDEARRINQEAEDARRLPSYDGMRLFLQTTVGVVADDASSRRAVVELTPLIDMYDKERSGILGTMDQGLLPFKSTFVRAVNA